VEIRFRTEIARIERIRPERGESMDADERGPRGLSPGLLHDFVGIFRSDRQIYPRSFSLYLGGVEFGDSIAVSRPLPVASALHSLQFSRRSFFIPAGFLESVSICSPVQFKITVLFGRAEAGRLSLDSFVFARTNFSKTFSANIHPKSCALLGRRTSSGFLNDTTELTNPTGHRNIKVRIRNHA
jgi:hypothetical protein